MSRIMELADTAIVVSFSDGLHDMSGDSKFLVTARNALQAEVTRVETELDRLTKEAIVKHEYEEAAEFYAECGPGPDQLKSWIIDTKEELEELRAQVTHWKESRQTAISAGELMLAELKELRAEKLIGDKP